MTRTRRPLANMPPIFDEKDQINGAVVLGQYVKIRKIEEFTKPMLRLHRQKMDIGFSTVSLNERLFGWTIACHNKFYRRMIATLECRLQQQMKCLFGTYLPGIKHDEVLRR